MIKKLVVILFLSVVVLSLILILKTKSMEFDLKEEVSGPRVVLEDFEYREYLVEDLVKVAGAKLGVLRENMDTELFSMVRYNNETTGRYFPCQLSSNHMQLRFFSPATRSGFYDKSGQLQYALIDSSVRISSKGERFLKTEAIMYENNKLFSDKESSLLDNNTSIYSKKGFLYDMNTDILVIDSFVNGDIQEWSY